MIRTTPLVFGGAPVGRHGHEVELHRQVDAPGQVAHEQEGALQDPDEQRRPVGVVGRDLLAERGDPALELVLGTTMRPSSRRARPPKGGAGGVSGSAVVHPCEPPASTVNQRKRRVPGETRTRSSIRYPSTQSGLPSGDGQQRVARPGVRPGRRPRPGRRRRPCGRSSPRGTNRSPGPAARSTARSPARSASTTAVHRPSGHRTGAARSTQLVSSIPNPTAVPGRATGMLCASGRRLRATAVAQGTVQPPAGPADLDAARQLRRPPLPPDHGQHRFDVVRRRRRRPEPQRAPPAGPSASGAGRPAPPASSSPSVRRAGAPTAPAPAPTSRSAARVSRRSESARATAAWRARTARRSRAAPASRAGMTSRRSQTRRWAGSAFIGSSRGRRPRRAQTAARSARGTSSSGRHDRRPGGPASRPGRARRRPGAR